MFTSFRKMKFHRPILPTSVVVGVLVCLIHGRFGYSADTLSVIYDLCSIQPLIGLLIVSEVQLYAYIFVCAMLKLVGYGSMH